MRLLLLVVFTILILPVAKAQTFVPFPDSAARWVNAGYYVGQQSVSLVYSEFICANGEDTVINALDYTKLQWCLNGNYKGALRDTLGKVYYVPKDSTSEFLVYDFSAMAGDTIEFYIEGDSFSNAYEYVIQGWDTILVNGEPRRRTYVDWAQWIEGIGCTTGFLQSPFSNVSNYAPYLYCMSVMDTIEYGVSASWGGTEIACDLFIGIEEKKIEIIELYPNPAKDYFSFSGEFAPTSVIITDVSGRQVQPRIIELNSEYRVELEDFKSGLYSVMVLSENRLYRGRLLVVR